MAFSYELILVKYLDILSASHSRSSFFDKRWDQDRFLFPGATSTKTRKSCRQQGLGAGKNSGAHSPLLSYFSSLLPCLLPIPFLRVEVGRRLVGGKLEESNEKEGIRKLMKYWRAAQTGQYSVVNRLPCANRYYYTADRILLSLSLSLSLFFLSHCLCLSAFLRSTLPSLFILLLFFLLHETHSRNLAACAVVVVVFLREETRRCKQG